MAVAAGHLAQGRLDPAYGPRRDDRHSVLRSYASARPETLTRRRASSARRQRSLAILVVLAVVGLLSLVVVPLTLATATLRTRAEINRLSGTKTQVEAERAALIAQRSRGVYPGRLETQAQRLGMRPVAAGQIIYLAYSSDGVRVIGGPLADTAGKGAEQTP